MSIIVTYVSGVGHTKLLAEIIAEAAGGTLMDVTQMDTAAWGTLNAANAIIFGSPTYMGSVAAPFKAFMDQSSDYWVERRWQDKLAAGFTIGSSPSGDKMNTLTTLAVFAAQHGMLWAGQSEIGPAAVPANKGINEDGFYLGLGVSNLRDKNVMIDEGGRETARRFGVRIAQAAARWAN